MRKKIEQLFVLVAALSWMIYNVGLWIGLGVGFVGYTASAFEYAYLESLLKSRK